VPSLKSCCLFPVLAGKSKKDLSRGPVKNETFQSKCREMVRNKRTTWARAILAIFSQLFGYGTAVGTFLREHDDGQPTATEIAKEVHRLEMALYGSAYMRAEICDPSPEPYPHPPNNSTLYERGKRRIVTVRHT